MAELKATGYKTPACESNVGNLNVDVMTHVLGGEAAGDVILMRNKNQYNSYVRLRLVASAAMAVAATVAVGYKNREGGADVLDAFGTGLDVNGTLVHDLIAGAPVEVPAKHDLAITLTTDPTADAGKSYTLIAEFISVSG